MKLSAQESLKVSHKNPDIRYPGSGDSRCNNGLLLPSLKPKFQLNLPAKIFTIGSCFARNIEEALLGYDVELPARNFSAPKSEWPFRPNGLLNEFNPGTISQRILSALDGITPPEETIVETRGGFIDLLLPPAGLPVSYERAIKRRSEIDEVYSNLASSDLVIMTLGLVEAWFDNSKNVFLNRMPDPLLFKKYPDRYSFMRLGVSDSFSLLDNALQTLIDAGVDKIILTVSPVPLHTTFTGEDAIVSNSFSKSVLRVCADKLVRKFEQIDYYPSFELVNSGGLSAFEEDNIHVKDEIVRLATSHMIDAYFTAASNH